MFHHNTMFRRPSTSAVIVLAMVLVGIVSRIELAGLPNVKPLAAMALLAAFYFRSAWLPCTALLIAMLASDFWLGTYHWQVAGSVYLALMFSCWLGSRVGRLDRDDQMDRQMTQLARVVVSGRRLMLASVVMSTSFFLLTNGAVWLAGQWYPPTFFGLMNCYLAGLPFYRLTLLGDLAFTVSGLAVWQTVVCWQMRTAAIVERPQVVEVARVS